MPSLVPSIVIKNIDAIDNNTVSVMLRDVKEFLDNESQYSRESFGGIDTKDWVNFKAFLEKEVAKRFENKHLKYVCKD